MKGERRKKMERIILRDLREDEETSLIDQEWHRAVTLVAEYKGLKRYLYKYRRFKGDKYELVPEKEHIEFMLNVTRRITVKMLKEFYKGKTPTEIIDTGLFGIMTPKAKEYYERISHQAIDNEYRGARLPLGNRNK